VPCKPFMPSLLFVCKAWVYPSEAPLRCSNPGYAPALHVNIRLSWKCLAGTNILAYYKHSLIMEEKSFITMYHGAHFIKLFHLVEEATSK
jgi:hypothetical protein